MLNLCTTNYKMNFRRLFFISFLFSQVLLAQDPYYVNYAIEDGLPSSNIYSVFQEDSGIIWFTTDVGIVKYNSKKFELYNTEDGLSDNEVFNMNTDYKGRIWMQTLNGKTCFIEDHKIYNQQNSPLIKKINGSGMCVDFYIDENKTTYFTYINGDIVSFDTNDVVKKHTQINNSSIAGVWKNDKQLYTIGSKFIYNVSENKILKNHANIPSRVYHLKNETVFSTKNILYATKNNDFSIILKLNDKYDIINVVEESKNKWWICTRNGVFLFKDGKISNPYFKDCIVSGILPDFEGNYWISTLNKGVLFVPSFKVNLLLPNKSINCLSSNNKGELWIGGMSNDYYIKTNTSIIEYSLSNELRKDKISNIRFFNNTSYIIGKSGIKIIDSIKSKFYNLSANDILIEKLDYFIGTTYTAKLSTDEFNRINLDTLHKKSILTKRTNILCKDDKNNKWLGTNFGLYRYHKNKKLKNFGLKNDKLSVSIEDLYFDNHNKTLLVATASKGLIFLKNDTLYKKVTLKDGLNNNTCNTIKKIKQNSYLIGTNNGLNLIDIKNNNVLNLNPVLGIKNKRIKDIEFINDTIYLATNTGVLNFDYTCLKQQKIAPKCIITKLTNEDGEISNHSSHYSKNDISIQFNGISYIDKGEVTYFYKLNNQDNKWSSTKESQVNYKSLPASKYTFKVYCVNGGGIKSDVQSILFKITPPFWQENWFKFLIFSLLVIVVYLIVKKILNKQKVKFEAEKLKIQSERDKVNLEKQLLELEQQALRMQMNPHFIFNALNTIKGYYAEGNDDKANDYISNFSMLLRMLLENTEPTVSLSTEIKMLNLYLGLTAIRYKNSFEYCIDIGKNVKQDEIEIPILLLQPIVENAIIHGLAPKKEKGTLLISFKKKKKQLECVVKDNGIGRKAALKNNKHKQHESRAIKITKERLNLITDAKSNQPSFYIEDLYNSNGLGIGTIVTINIPYKKIW